MNCPHCKKPIPDATVKAAWSSIAGSKTGPNKARTSEQARAAVNARWEKHRKSQPRKKEK